MEEMVAVAMKPAEETNKIMEEMVAVAMKPAEAMAVTPVAEMEVMLEVMGMKVTAKTMTILEEMMTRTLEMGKTVAMQLEVGMAVTIKAEAESEPGVIKRAVQTPGDTSLVWGYEGVMTRDGAC